MKNKYPRSGKRHLTTIILLLLTIGTSLANEVLPGGGQGPPPVTDSIPHPADTTRHSRDDFRQRLERQEREAINRDNPAREAMSHIRAWWQTTRRQQLPATATATRYIAIKTNIAAWAVTALNAAIEIQAGRHLSVDIPVAWCPWDIGRDHAARFLLLQPEARHWFDRPGKGHFVGIHVHLGWFNVKWNDNRYQDTSRPLIGTGIGYGYAAPLGRHWGAEFSIGAGYANTRFDTYYNIKNGARVDTSVTGYWGITRLGINLVYHLNSK